MSTSNALWSGGRSRRGRLLALLSATAVAASLLSVPSSQSSAAANPASTSGSGRPAASVPAGAEPVAVTLITGDTVYWQDDGNGSPRIEIEQAPRETPVEFDRSGTQEDFYVIPSDAMDHVVAGTLDDELFNIPALIRQGLDDATTDALPVIVIFDHDRSAPQLARDARALPGTGDATLMEEINGAGVKVNRSEASSFRQSVLGAPGRHGSATAAEPGLEGTVKQILLDQKLYIDLAESVPQIGAPQAWDAGYTGEGVTVAVLDTGIDSDHPDLAGQVVAETNFTDEPDATDRHGHGTHVASTIAGTGAASDGARTGVAPGAHLLNGKVCFSNAAGQGECHTSAIMAGMEWATEQGADIVNMSLGSPTSSDGTDPLSQLVNTLSAETGTLFVTSAGNGGPGAQTVGSPGAAEAALAVGAVDKSDQLATFSSRGPRVGDHAVKPEITAPGVNIVAARAEGTGAGKPIDDDYTSLNGTSMASPHVAGAAALLAQAKPNLGGHALKDALVSTSTDTGRLWWEQGLGRVNVPTALASPIYATGTVNLGHVTDHAEQDITYTNQSADDITLALSASVTDTTGQAIDVARLSTDTLTVPAGGQATATLTVNITNTPDRDNLFGGGGVTAIGNGVSVRTGIGFGPVRHTVSIEVLDSHGDRIGTRTAADRPINIDHDSYDPARPVGKLDYSFSTANGIATGQLPTGTYTLITVVREENPGTGEFVRGNVLIKVDVVIEADTSVVLDARDAVPVQVTVPREADQRNHDISLMRQRANIHPGIVSSMLLGGSLSPMFITPTSPRKSGFLALLVHWLLAEPQPVHPLPWSTLCDHPNPQFRIPDSCYSDAPAYIYNLSFVYRNGIPGDLHETVARRDLVEVPSRFHADQREDMFINHQFESAPPFPFAGGGRGQRMWITPGEVTEYFLADDRVTWHRKAFPHHSPEGTRPPHTFDFGQVSDDRFLAAEAGTRRHEERWFEGPLRVGAADVRTEYVDNPGGFAEQAAASRGGTGGNVFIPGYYIMDNARGHLTDPRSTLPSFASWRMWNLNTGAELEAVEFDPEVQPGVPAFTLAATEATYRLGQTGTYPIEAADQFLTGPATTTWTFTSAPSEVATPAGYACPHQLVGEPARACQIQPLIQLEYHLSLDIHNRVAAGRAHRFSILAGHHSSAIGRAPVTDLRVQASFDDGATWQRARVVGKPRDSLDTGGLLPSRAPYQQFHVVLVHPPLYRSNGFVALRVQATDVNGSTIEQTIQRAYILK